MKQQLTIFRGFRYKLAPTVDQETLFWQFSGVCRLIYNLAFEQRRDFWRHYERHTGQKLNYFAQTLELTSLRNQFDWIGAVSQSCQQQALRDLDKAFINFFNGNANYPTPRKMGVNDAFQFRGRECEIKRLNAKWSSVRLPKIGWVKFRDTRPMRGTVKNITIAHDALGWHVSFGCEIARTIPLNASPSVGIDRGIENTIALSTGERRTVPHTLIAIEQGCRRAQRVAARGKRGSKRHAKALRRVAALSARRARIRRDWHQKTSLDIANRFGVVVIEALQVKGMTASAKGTVAEPGRGVRQKAGLNRSILNQGWFCFENILAYKLEERGGNLVKVDPAYTSQTCSECGTVDSKSRESQASFCCRHCGFRIHADHNAAINILRRNTASMRMEEGRLLSDEVRTRRVPLRSENPSVAKLGRMLKQEESASTTIPLYKGGE